MEEKKKNAKKEIVKIIFWLGKDSFRRATPREIEDGIFPWDTWSSIVLYKDGTWVEVYDDPLGR